MISKLSRRYLLIHLVCLMQGKNFLTNSEIPQVKPNPNSNNPVRKLKILIVGMSESPHLQTWVDGIKDAKLVDEIWLFPSDFPVHKWKISEFKVHEFPFIGIGKLSNISFRVLDIATKRLWRSYFLFRMIKKVNPTHIHFHEMQHGAYLYNSIYRHPKHKFSGRIITSTWGSDLLFYGSLKSHEEEIRKSLSWTQILTSERFEDLEIATRFDFNGEFKAPVYITIGKRATEQFLSATSSRKMVLVKGHQDLHGRALNALECIRELSLRRDLSQFSFRVFSAPIQIRQQVEFMKSNYNLDIDVLPRMSKLELQDYYMKSRVYLGLSASDGLSTSMVEAMSNGTFPIQSENSSAPLFLENNLTGGVVNPWDKAQIVEILEKALFDNEMVNTSARKNLESLGRKYSWEMGIEVLRDLYK